MFRTHTVPIRIGISVLIAAILLPLQLTAQSSTASNSTPPSGTYQDSVVVTASLGESSESEVPVTVHVIDAEEIAERRVDSIVDLIGGLPGVHAVTSGSPGQQASLFVRGAESDQTLVLWNGVPLNDPYFGGFNWAFLPTEGLDRVEIVSGPQSALYGSAAAGGVVQLISREAPGSSLDLEAGENSHYRLATSLRQATDRWKFELDGHWREGDGNFPNDFYDSIEGVGAAHFSANDNLQVGLRLRRNDSEVGIPFSGSRASLNRRIDWQESQLAVPFSGASRSWDVEGYLGRIDYDNHFSDPDDPFGFTKGRTESVAERGRAVFTYRPSEHHWIAAGVDAEALEVSDLSSFGQNLDGAKQKTTGLFTQFHFAADGFGLEVGGRYDDNDVYGSETSPRLGLTYQVHPGIRLRASYGEGFRSPSLGELFFPFSGNPDLDPERSEGYEVGAQWQHAAWSLDLVTFETRFSNLIDYDFAAGGNVNLGRAKTQGTELELGYRTGRFTARAQWSWLDAKSLVDNTPLKRRPEDAGSLSLSFRPAAWTVNLTTRYAGPRDDVDPVTFGSARNPSYLRHDLAVRWKVHENLTPYLRVVNADDEEYEEALGFPAPGRTFVAGVTLSR